MKIAITGHTTGIGKAFFDFYTSEGHEVVGYSRSNGYDFADESNIGRAVSEIVDCDMLINNAYYNNCQIKLMHMLHHFWKAKTDKIHIVIGSRAADIPTPNAKYSEIKKSIDQVAIELQKVAAYRLLVVKPGRVNTPTYLKMMKEPKPTIDANNLVVFIDTLINNRTLDVVSITVEPTIINREQDAVI